MSPLLITLLVMVMAGIVAFLLLRSWSVLLGPRLRAPEVRREVHKHPRAAAILSARFDPSALTGLALTTAAAVAVVGAVMFGVVFLMIRDHFGFASFDGGAARFAARHATHTSTTVLRMFSQLGGAVVLVPLSFVVWLLNARRGRPRTSLAFLVLAVGGQFALADLVKWVVDRTRPNLDRLTGFSGPSFPSGHATASAASLAAFALLISAGRSSRVQVLFGSLAVALACGIACTRVFLGVHWLTDVIGGLVLGWSWFAICSIAFGGRLLRFGPAEQMEEAVEPEGSTPPRGESTPR